MLPASVYPLEIVQAARFVKDTNNLAKLDAQPWDVNVKAVARVPQVIQKMNSDLPWTMELGEAFLAQDKDLFDAIQTAARPGPEGRQPQNIPTANRDGHQRDRRENNRAAGRGGDQHRRAGSAVQPAGGLCAAHTVRPWSTCSASARSDRDVDDVRRGHGRGATIANNNCDWHHGGCYGGDVDIDVNRVNINNGPGGAGGPGRAGGRGRSRWRGEQVNQVDSGVGERASRQAGQQSAQKWQPDSEPPEQERVTQRRGFGPDWRGARLWFQGGQPFGRERRSAVGRRQRRGTAPASQRQAELPALRFQLRSSVSRVARRALLREAVFPERLFLAAEPFPFRLGQRVQWRKQRWRRCKKCQQPGRFQPQFGGGGTQLGWWWSGGGRSSGGRR